MSDQNVFVKLVKSLMVCQPAKPIAAGVFHRTHRKPRINVAENSQRMHPLAVVHRIR